MRALLHEAWPALTYHFGLHPWDVDRLSREEWNGYLFALEDINRQNKQQKQR